MNPLGASGRCGRKDGGPGTSPGARGGTPGPGTGADARMERTPREKRMLRWHMKFTANNGREYVNQLAALGAILAVPVGDRRGPEQEYRVVHDLRGRPALLDEK